MAHFFQKLFHHKVLLVSLGAVFLYATTLVFASGGPYAPHGTLDPACLPTANTCYVTSGVTIGDPVNGGTPTQVLYTDNSGNVTSDSGFTRDSATGFTSVFASITPDIGAGVIVSDNVGGSGVKGSFNLYSDSNSSRSITSFSGVGDTTAIGFSDNSAIMLTSDDTSGSNAFFATSADATTGFARSTQTVINGTSQAQSIFDRTSIFLGFTPDVSGHQEAGLALFPARADLQYIDTNGTNKNIVRSDATGVSFYTNGSQAAQIDTSGNFGIGTNNPSARLNVVGIDSLSASTALHIQNSSNASLLNLTNNGTFLLGSSSTQYTGSSNSEDAKMFFDPANKVFRVGSVLGNEWNTSNNGTGTIAIGFVIPSFSIPGPISDGSGSVAIGSNANSHGIGTIAMGIGSSSDGSGAIAMGNNATANDDGDVALGGRTTTSDGLGGSHNVAIGTDLTVLGGNSVAIGDDNTVNARKSVLIGNNLQTTGDTEVILGSYNTVYTPTTTSTDRLFDVGDGSSTGTADAFMILKNGKTGIGISNFETTSSSALLQVGTSAWTGDMAFFQNSAGSCQITNPSGWTCSSDSRLKNNITDLSQYGLASILALRPVSFDWNALPSTQTKSLGFIAQEVQSVIPEIVATNSSNGYLTLNTTEMTPVIVRAIQELNLKIQPIADLTTTNNTFVAQLVAWMSNQANGVTDFFAGRVHTHELCIDDVCVTKTQLQQMLQNQSGSMGGGGSTSGGGTTTGTSTDATGAPVVTTGSVDVTSTTTTDTPTIPANSDTTNGGSGQPVDTLGTTPDATTTSTQPTTSDVSNTPINQSPDGGTTVSATQ
jgi:hypothetical protein